MPTYIKTTDVKVRLLGKVRFTTDAEDENEMQESLLTRLVDEAESEVEHDLSPRYMAPFQSDDGRAFSTLPIRPTQNLIKTLCELKAVERVLETDFGRGTAVEGDKYMESVQKRYQKIIKQLTEKRDGQFGHFAYPPLPSLRLNWHNTEADDGYAGRVLVSGDSNGDYAARRINDPSQNYWNGLLTDEPIT